MTTNDYIDDGGAPYTRHISRCVLEEVQDTSEVHNAMFSYYKPFGMKREIDDLMKVIDDDFTLAREEDSSGKTHFTDHVVIVSPGVNTMCEPAMCCVDLNKIVDNIPMSTRRTHDDNLAQGRLSIDDFTDNGFQFQNDVIWSAINDFFDSKRCEWESKGPREWIHTNVIGNEHVADAQDIFNIATTQADYIIKKRHHDRLHVDCLPCEEQSNEMTRSIDVAEADRTDRVIVEWCWASDSMLGQASTYSKGCRVIRLTIDDDLRTPEGLEVALDIVKSCPIGRTLLWSAMPRTGGSPWQRLNIAQGKGLAKITAHWADFRALWQNFDLVAKEAIAIKDGLHRVLIGKLMEWLHFWNDMSLIVVFFMVVRIGWFLASTHHWVLRSNSHGDVQATTRRC
jgi:hypothetical protein